MEAALSRRSGLRSHSAITFAPGCAITLVRSALPRFPTPITPAPISAADVCARATVAAAPNRKCLRFTLFIGLASFAGLNSAHYGFQEFPRAACERIHRFWIRRAGHDRLEDILASQRHVEARVRDRHQQFVV